MMNFSLFEYESYCKTCTEWISPANNYKVARILDIMNTNDINGVSA